MQLQSKAESKAKRLGWGARLEAAAQAGAGAEVRPTIVSTDGTAVGANKPVHILTCMWKFLLCVCMSFACIFKSFRDIAPDSSGPADMLFAVHVAYPNFIS